jgi:outer membrane cobalamin receptor
LVLLAGAGQAPLLAQEEAAPAEDAAEAPAADAAAAPAGAPPLTDEEMLDQDDELDEEEIVVTGSRPRGSVLGDIEPEVQLDRREIRALGAGNLAELLEALAPQTRSGRGRGEGRPVMLVNGRRISGFSEIRTIPPEAIERIDILPEEVALKYGYRADQRVVNFVLRRRFRAVTAEVEGGLATAGGRGSYEAEVNFLRIDRAGRWSLDAEYEHADPLFESERDIVQAAPVAADLGDFRTLLSETDQFSLGGTLNRTVLGNVSATVNGRLDGSSSRAFLGLRANTTDAALTRESDTLAGHLGLALNGDISPSWRWSAVSNYDRSHTDTLTERDAGNDRAESTSQSGTAELVANGSLFGLPAGEVSTTLRAGAEARSLDSETLRAGVFQARELERQRGNFQANLDLPIASHRRAVLGALGDLSLNFNAEVEHLSDFGTLRTLGAGLNWSPIPEVDLIASVTDEDGAPSMQQLGDPVLLTPNVRVFDFLRGETVEISRLEGGNPDLLADNRRVLKLGATVRPLGETDLAITANYTASRIERPIASFPTATPEIEAAFPDRFTRDSGGRLLRIDSRPVNFARSDRQELRWGVNFSTPIGPQPQPPAGGWRGRRGQGAGGGGTPPEGGAAPPTGGGEAGGQGPRGRWQGGGGQGRGGSGGRRGGFGGGGRGGRLQLALYHNWRLEDRILIREGLPELDLLGGSAVGSRGGQPRHELELQTSFAKNGFGARLNANWQSGTHVRGGPDGLGGTTNDLFFSDFATVNLRLFADLGQQRSLVREHRWLRGTRISLSVDNLFDSRLKVRDETGSTPLSYQPGFLDPLGRSVRITLRKLFF